MSHILACSRMPVADCPAKLPPRFIEALEQNQQIASCCRHPENHDIEAFHSSEAQKASPVEKGAPDIYIFHCTCGRKHRRFMVGSGPRPSWEVR